MVLVGIAALAGESAARQCRKDHDRRALACAVIDDVEGAKALTAGEYVMLEGHRPAIVSRPWHQHRLALSSAHPLGLAFPHL